MRARSLEATFFAGTLAIVVPVVAAFALFVFVRERRAADRYFEEALRLRAQAVAGLVEIDLEKGIVEVEPSPPEMPEFARGGSGAYFSIADETGRAFARSPSLGDESLPDPLPGPAARPRFFRVAPGPFGRPCVVGEFEFRAVPGSGHDDEEDGDAVGKRALDDARAPGADGEPDEKAGHVLVSVALETRERDEALSALAGTMSAAGLVAIAVALAGAAFLARRLVVPIRRMTAAAARTDASGARERLVPSTMVRELESLAETLNAAFDALTEALERQKRFTADAGHELRTPVTVLHGNAELLLRRDRTAAEYRAGLAVQLRAARRMARIVDGLLFLARADAGRYEPERREVDLAALARSACEDFESSAREAGIEIESSGPGPAIALGDAAFLRVVADNLVSNAVKYTPRGGRARWRAWTENGHACLSVANTGPGIAAEHLPRLFERFYRGAPDVDPDRAAPPGSGLGLSIVDRIVRAHGGTVSATSRPGEGAEFTVRIPAAREERPATVHA